PHGCQVPRTTEYIRSTATQRIMNEEEEEKSLLEISGDEDFIREPATDSRPLWLASTAVTYLFHPLLLLVYAFFFVDIFFPYQFMHLAGPAKSQLLLALIINTVAFPLITLGLMRGLKIIPNFELNSNKERILPFIAIML